MKDYIPQEPEDEVARGMTYEAALAHMQEPSSFLNVLVRLLL